MKYKITEIEYDIEPEDFQDEIDESDYALRSDFIKDCESLMEDKLESQPSEMEVELDDEFGDEQDIQDKLADEISDRTGWLVKSFKYEKE